MSDYRVIPLSRGLVTVVDASDFEWLAAHKWFAQPSGSCFYAKRHVQRRGVITRLKMHRVILGVDTFVDHINRDTLDNRRANLRVCDRAQNAWNAPSGRANGFRGVFQRRESAWVANIRVRGVVHYLGRFSDPESAARAYDAAALRLHGEFATLNFGCLDHYPPPVPANDPAPSLMPDSIA